MPGQITFPSDSHGGKAAVLMELQSAGFRVPRFVVSPADLEDAVNSIGTPLAVRSSATLEDSEGLSFAGQFSSFLNLYTLQDAQAAVRDCVDSIREPSVIAYCRKNNIDPDRLRMEFIVQRMVNPELAGVAFTVNPVTGAEDVYIEACEGLADELLAGRQAALPDEHALLKKYRPEIEETARQLHLHFGSPQDIEFAIEDGKLYVLQSRPITRISFAPSVGEWTNANFRDGGVSSGSCSPLMWSLYDFIWEDALKGLLREIKLLRGDFTAGRMFFGRPYWNIGAVKQCFRRLPGFVEREFDNDLGVKIQYQDNGSCTPKSLLRLLRSMPTLYAIDRFLTTQETSAKEMLSNGFAGIERRHEIMPEDATSAFRELVERDYYSVEKNYFRTVFAAFLAKIDFKVSFPQADYTSLLVALPEMRHTAPMRALREMAEGGNLDVSSILKEFRHHCRWGLDVRGARWDEDRKFVEELLDCLPLVERADPHPAYEQALTEALSGLPRRKHKSFTKKLNRLRSFVWLREELRDLSGRMYYIIRRYVLEIARRRGIGDDIFFMTFLEIFEDDRSNVERKREIFDSYCNFQAPDEIGARFAFDSRAEEGTLQGIGVNPGTVSGVSCLALTVEEALYVQPGSILVCPFIEPGWIPVLDRVAGVVTETGGLLSHAAVICREYGIPAVLGVPEATVRIADGQQVLLDGASGNVELIDGPNITLEQPREEFMDSLLRQSG